MNLDLLSKIENSSIENRDIIVDELNDEIEEGNYNSSEITEITRKLLDILKSEEDAATHESILNLISSLYIESKCKIEIENYILEYMGSIKPGSLIHALSILSESTIVDKESILRKYANAENATIRSVANRYLSVSAKR